jgi:hypothetical protein
MVKIDRIPVQERQFGHPRQQKSQEELYLYLQKRETAILLAATRTKCQSSRCG